MIYRSPLPGMQPYIEVIERFGSITVDLNSHKGMSVTWAPDDEREPYEMAETDGTFVKLYVDGVLTREYYVLSLVRVEQMFLTMSEFVRNQEKKRAFEHIKLEEILDLAALSNVIEDLNT